MPFPLSIAGTVSVSKRASGFTNLIQATVRIEDMLDTALATETRRDGLCVTFTRGWWGLMSNRNVLSYFNSGRITISESREALQVKYSCSTIGMLIVVTLMIGLIVAFTVGLQLSRSATVQLDHFWFFGIGWLWLFGGNYVMAAIRFPRWLDRGLRRTALHET